jgi:DNA modification methylase
MIVQLILGDCIEVMKSIPDKSVDLVYADMMYGNLCFDWIDVAKKTLKTAGSIYVQTDYRSVAQLKLYMDNLFLFQNWIVWCYKDCPTRQNRYQRKHDDILFYTMSDGYAWNNPTQPPSKSSLKTFRTDSEGKILNPSPGMIKRGSTHYIRDVVCRDWWDDVNRNKKKALHKWQKPESLLRRIILASSNPGDTILDPFKLVGTSSASK